MSDVSDVSEAVRKQFEDAVAANEQELAEAQRHITRHKRVRIVSKDGMPHNAEVFDETTGQHELAWGTLDIQMRPGRPNTAQITCYLPETDIVADAEVEIVSYQVMRLNSSLLEAVDALSDCAKEPGHEHLLPLVSKLKRTIVYQRNTAPARAQMHAEMRERIVQFKRELEAEDAARWAAE